MQSLTTLAIMCIAVFAVSLTGCAGPSHGGNNDASRPPYDRAEVIIYIDPEARPISFRKTIDRPEEISRLASYFPGMDGSRRSWVYGKWRPWIAVNFVKADESVIAVRSDYRDWSEGEGRGDFRVRGDLADYARELLANRSER